MTFVELLPAYQVHQTSSPLSRKEICIDFIVLDKKLWQEMTAFSPRTHHFPLGHIIEEDEVTKHCDKAD